MIRRAECGQSAQRHGYACANPAPSRERREPQVCSTEVFSKMAIFAQLAKPQSFERVSVRCGELSVWQRDPGGDGCQSNSS